jgi:hypothetical protein
MKRDELGLNQQQLAQALRRLSHFAPTELEEGRPHRIHDHLVEHALASLHDRPVGPCEVQAQLEQLFSLTFDAEEVYEAVRRLQLKGRVLVTPDGSGDILVAHEAGRREEMLRQIAEAERLEEGCLTSWQDTLVASYPSLTTADVTGLRSDLQDYAVRLFAAHGAECVALLYPQSDKAEGLLADAEGTFVTRLPPRKPLVARVRDIEVPNFFRKPDEQRAKYISQLLDSTFLLHLLHVDESCSALLMRQFHGRLLFLDTNVLYRLLNLQGPRFFTSAKRMVEMSTSLGFRVLATTRTVRELRTSFNSAKEDFERNPPLRADLAAVGAEYSGDDDLITAYWRQYSETGISFYDFFTLFADLGPMITQLGVEVTSEYDQVMADSRDVRQTAELLRDALDLGYTLHPDVLEHDAYHAVLIRRVRGLEPATFADANAWFITCDTKLPRFARIKRRNLGMVPFCMTPSEWFQVIRPMVPRTASFDAAFAQMLTSPYLRAYRMPREVAHHILARLQLLRSWSPDLAVRVLTNSVMIDKFRRASEDEKDAIIESAAAQAAEELRVEVSALKAEVKELRAKVEKAHPGSKPKVLIAHSGDTKALYKLTRFLNDLGVEPVVAEWLPYKGRQVPDHVRDNLAECACAVVFATRVSKSQPGRGVLIETGILQEHFGERVVYLAEHGVAFGPMADSFARESFSRRNLERVFHRLVIEFKQFGIV